VRKRKQHWRKVVFDVKEAVLVQTLLPDGEQIRRNALFYMVAIGLDDGDEELK
jgi:hypothetical protein